MKRTDNRIKPSEITPEDVYINRRKLMAGAVALGLAGCEQGANAQESGKFAGAASWDGSTDERLTPFEAASSYNNYYEFGTGKDDPARYAHTLEPDPWSVEITGEADRTGTYTLEDILAPHTIEERIYRLRCVERWSMVIPWNGIPMADLLARFEPRSSAKYVQFFTLADRDQMPGLANPVLSWPYLEGLTIEEAMNPLTFAAVGMYGKVMPNQNGAPIRVVVPWKYGYKGAKSVVRINFTDEKPRLTTESKREGDWTWQTAWNEYAGNEYGFYSNVNPNRPHPRWSQQVERRLDGRFPERTIDTQMFNGYGEQVAHLYQGMDLIKHH